MLRLPEPTLAKPGPVPTLKQRPYADRRALLGELRLERPGLGVVAKDGRVLFDAVCDRGLEGVVPKRLRDPYRPGERLWVKTKNRATTRFAEERDRATAATLR